MLILPRIRSSAQPLLFGPVSRIIYRTAPQPWFCYSCRSDPFDFSFFFRFIYPREGGKSVPALQPVLERCPVSLWASGADRVDVLWVLLLLTKKGIRASPTAGGALSLCLCFPDVPVAAAGGSEGVKPCSSLTIIAGKAHFFLAPAMGFLPSLVVTSDLPLVRG